MTNSEKYLKDGVDDRDFAKALSNYIADGGRKITDREVIRAETLYFLTDEAKPILTEDERVILRNLGQECKTIFRNDGGLYFYTEDHKGIFPDLFQFIKERRRI